MPELDSDEFMKIEPEGGANESNEVVRNPMLGTIYMLGFVFIQSVQWFSTKLVYVYYP